MANNWRVNCKSESGSVEDVFIQECDFRAENGRQIFFFIRTIDKRSVIIFRDRAWPANRSYETKIDTITLIRSREDKLLKAEE